MNVGKPTSYNDELLEKAKQYLNYFLQEESDIKIVPAGQVIPTAVGLCSHIGIGTSTSSVWEKDDTKLEYRAVLDGIKQVQHIIALNGGMAGTFNAPIVKLLLTKHGYHDKSEQDVKSSDGSMTPTFSGLYGKPKP
jgi:hypothetical protein